ncbi:hypothetical protein SO802_026112 [Lithocarpus litseifolius]|uniref:Uncharacterized protein n=1 Tax=Lithocarpus litseifolius TaxID=425828 RepID=A0AAW2C1A0_9ROSI
MAHPLESTRKTIWKPYMGSFSRNYCWKMVDVDNLVWKMFRKWGCPTYEELYTIFIKPKVTGEQDIVTGGDRSGRNYLAHSREDVNAIVLHGYNKRQSA